MKLITFLFFVFTSIFSSNLEEEKIPWSEDYQLTWADFKSPSSNGSGFVASTSSGIAYSYSFGYDSEKGKMAPIVKVSCNFYPERSWFSKENASDYILKHEQTHFDISEIYARKLRKEIAKTKFSDNMSEELEALFYKFEDERTAFQKQFDKETDHSKIYDKEIEWEALIEEQLKEYERWK